MKLSLAIPRIALPDLPFLKRRTGGSVGGLESGIDSDMDVPADSSRKSGFARLARLVGLGLAGFAAVGGLGTLVGWLIVNGPDTVAERKARQPAVTVAILKNGEPTPANSSRAAPKTETKAEKPAASAEAGAGGTAAPGVPAAPVATEGPFFEPALIEQKDHGRLPIVAPDGRKAWQVYARPLQASGNAPRIAILVARLGISPVLTRAAIQYLRPEISLSFAAFAGDLDRWVGEAQKAGHEVFLDLPMEPVGFPANDPGPNTLLTSLSMVENLNRLEGVLGRTVGYAGVVSYMGSQFSTSEESLAPVLDALKTRGLMYVDSAETSRTMAPELAASIQLPRVIADRIIGTVPARAAIERELAALEQSARQTGFAVGIVHPLPLTLDLVAAWSTDIEKRGLLLAPITAMANKQNLR